LPDLANPHTDQGGAQRAVIKIRIVRCSRNLNAMPINCNGNSTEVSTASAKDKDEAES
jgi:hypothetical protein